MQLQYRGGSYSPINSLEVTETEIMAKYRGLPKLSRQCQRHLVRHLAYPLKYGGISYQQTTNLKPIFYISKTNIKVA